MTFRQSGLSPVHTLPAAALLLLIFFALVTPFTHILSSPISYLKGVGPQRAEMLQKELGIFTFEDLLMHLPFRYVDRTQVLKIKEVTGYLPFVQVKGKLAEKNVAGQGKSQRLTAYLTDGTGEIELIWFQGLRWIDKSLETGRSYLVFGKPNYFKGVYSIVHPEISLLDEETQKELLSPGLQPVYPSTEKLKTHGLHSRGIEKLVRTLFAQVNEKEVMENLPLPVVKRYDFFTRFQSFQKVHLPKTEEEAERAKNRLRFEEFFFSQLRILQLKSGRKKLHNGFVFTRLGDFFNRFYNEQLPFVLTDAQKKVVKEIRGDLLSGCQMNRLLQGDVGSGKTIVALLTMLMAVDNGFQACLMAPTEILAQQHLDSIRRLTRGLGLRLALLTGSVKNKERRQLLQALKDGELHLLIGTHALLEDKVVFHNLGLVVIDEQHRFGVKQRALLWAKNKKPPHILVMTATPIPRTLAMTVYGDLDSSVIDQLPPGRKPITTAFRNDGARLQVFGFMKNEIAKGRQVYVVYPFIEESAKLDFKFLMDGYESITRAFPLPEYAVSIVHGKMKSENRDYEMRRFVKGETQIMVATTVIEVGVDVPNASVMVIESAERFGLSQLHQLRGRVGRGADQSYCILMGGDKMTHDARSRLNIMVLTNDGFRIAEEDMRLRGPGDIEGTQQSGLTTFKVANLIHDQKWLQAARSEIEKILEADPTLSATENAPIKSYLMVKKRSDKEWSRIS